MIMLASLLCPSDGFLLPPVLTRTWDAHDQPLTDLQYLSSVLPLVSSSDLSATGLMHISAGCHLNSLLACFLPCHIASQHIHLPVPVRHPASSLSANPVLGPSPNHSPAWPATDYLLEPCVPHHLWLQLTSPTTLPVLSQVAPVLFEPSLLLRQWTVRI